MQKFDKWNLVANSLHLTNPEFGAERSWCWWAAWEESGLPGPQGRLWDGWSSCKRANQDSRNFTTGMEVAFLRSASGGLHGMFLGGGREGATPVRGELDFRPLWSFFELQPLGNNFATLPCAEAMWSGEKIWMTCLKLLEHERKKATTGRAPPGRAPADGPHRNRSIPCSWW